MSVLSVEEAFARKESQANVEAKTWHTSIFANAAAFVSFLNIVPAQQAGEAFASNRADGRVDGYYFL
jgi:hypothetical protein